MRFFSDNETSFPVFLKFWPSSDPVTEKAQQEPHCPFGRKGVESFFIHIFRSGYYLAYKSNMRLKNNNKITESASIY